MVDKIWYNMEELIGGSEERGINRNILECKDTWQAVAYIPSGCINRNILECKVKILLIVLFLLSCINRNILECKACLCGRGYVYGKPVLIETYWNVKKYTQTADLGYIPY